MCPVLGRRARRVFFGQCRSCPTTGHIEISFSYRTPSKRSFLQVQITDNFLKVGFQPLSLSASQPIDGLSASPPLRLYFGLEAKSSDNNGEQLRATKVRNLHGTMCFPCCSLCCVCFQTPEIYWQVKFAAVTHRFKTILFANKFKENEKKQMQGIPEIFCLQTISKKINNHQKQRIPNICCLQTT